MSSLLLLPSPSPAVLAWLSGILAGMGGMALHLLMPPRDPAVAEAILQASVHP